MKEIHKNSSDAITPFRKLRCHIFGMIASENYGILLCIKITIFRQAKKGMILCALDGNF